MKWGEGRALLEKICEECSGERRDAVAELCRYARAAEIHFTEDLLHTRYSHLKRDLIANADALLEIFDREETLARDLIALAA